MSFSSPYDEDGSRLDLTDDENGDGACCGGVFQLDSQQLMFATLVSTSVFTVSQFVGAVASNSLSLYGDSCDMAVDATTYVVNWYVERTRSNRSMSAPQLQKLENAATLVSGVALLVATMVLFYFGEQRLQHPDTTSTEDPGVVMAFSSVNLALDVVQITFFLRHFFTTGQQHQAANVNLVSAGMHIMADTLRTVSELVSAQLSLSFGFDPVATDAWASFVVNLLVVGSALFLLKTVCTRMWRQRQGDSYVKVSQVLMDDLVMEVEEAQHGFPS
jgi:Co/Zn/Cd efflux system component